MAETRPEDPGWDGSTPLLSRFRRVVLGERSPETDTAASVSRSLGAASVLSPIWTTPFDSPPEEAVELDRDALPWELDDTLPTMGAGDVVADWDDVERIASALPGTVEQQRFRHRSWGTTVAFVWERPFTKADRAREPEPLPDGPILGARVADEGEKRALLAAEPEHLMTIQHFEGFPAVLVLLDRVPVDRLEEIITDAWLAVSPATTVAPYLEAHPELRG